MSEGENDTRLKALWNFATDIGFISDMEYKFIYRFLCSHSELSILVKHYKTLSKKDKNDISEKFRRSIYSYSRFTGKKSVDNWCTSKFLNYEVRTNPKMDGMHTWISWGNIFFDSAFITSINNSAELTSYTNNFIKKYEEFVDDKNSYFKTKEITYRNLENKLLECCSSIVVSYLNIAHKKIRIITNDEDLWDYREAMLFINKNERIGRKNMLDWVSTL
jgi:hypothetical protein